MGEDLARIASVFAAARRLDPEARAAFVRSSCGDDATLRREVEALLAAHESAPEPGEADPLLPPRPDLAAEVLGVASGDGAPPQVPGFRILARLADGGMGTVYVAEQEKPRRRVALKILRPDAATADGRRRFDLEAQVLARLDHPGIARVHVFGTTEGPGAPRPFLAMELVEGEPLTVAGRRMDLSARVALLAEVAEAVAHAHAKGVIHRDLKPDNVLVRPDGVVKVVDFGVARLVDEDVPSVTRAGFVIGTLAYMSPEQARGDVAAIDTRSDVYSLGVVGYELLCGRHPLGDREGTFTELVRRILEEEAEEPAAVDRALRGDLDLILRKALAKEPDRRYANASALAEDLRRHLQDEPILARPPTGAWQVRRFLRRHKAFVAGGAATFLALVVGLVIALSFARSERRQRVRADRNAEVMREALARRDLEIAQTAAGQHDAATALAALERVPEAMRGWEWRYLRGAADQCVAHQPLGVGPLKDARLGAAAGTSIVITQSGALWEIAHDGSVRSLELPEGAYQPVLARLGDLPVVVCRQPEGLIVVDAEGRTVLDAAIRSRTTVSHAGGSPDGRLLGVTTSGGVSWSAVQVYDVSTGRSLLQAPAGLVGISAVAFDPADTTVFTAGWEGIVRGRSLQEPQELTHVLRRHDHDVRAIAVAPSGRVLATGSADRTARLWSLETNELVRDLGRQSGEVEAVAFSPDGARLVGGGRDGRLTLWDVGSGQVERVLTGHRGAIRDVRFDDAGVLRSLGDDGLRTWRTGGGAGVLRFHGTEEVPRRKSYVYGVAFAPDGVRLASAAWDGTVRVVDVGTGRLERTIRCPDASQRVLGWSPDGRWLYAGRVHLSRWDAATGEEQAVRDLGPDIASLAVLPDSDGILVGNRYGKVFHLRGTDLETIGTWVFRGGGGVYDLDVSPAGDAVASIVLSGQVEVRSLPGGEPRWSQAAHRRGEFGAVAFSPGGRRLATGGPDGLVRLWDASTGEALATLTGHTDAVFALAWLPDGSRLASGSNDGTILVWDPGAGQVRLRLTGHESYVYRLAVSPDGTTLASGSGDGTVRLWSARDRAAREGGR